jgi:hypothetical protein
MRVQGGEASLLQPALGERKSFENFSIALAQKNIPLLSRRQR